MSYRSTAAQSLPRPGLPAQPSYHPAQVEMADVTGVTAMALTPTGSGDVVEQLNAAAARHAWSLPIAIVVGVLGLFTLPYGVLIWALAAPLCWWLILRDKARRTVVLFYEVSDARAFWFEALTSNWVWLTDSSQLWREVQSGRVQTTYQHKTNAGASSLVKRISAAAGLAGPRHLATNVAVPSVSAGGSSLHFLPDRVLLFDNRRYTDISYRYLRAHAYRQRFIESRGSRVKDAQQVDQTWQYVNVKGGPDRRFANNPVLPIMLYGNLHFGTPHGLDWRLQISRPDAASAIGAVLSDVPEIEEIAF